MPIRQGHFLVVGLERSESTASLSHGLVEPRSPPPLLVRPKGFLGPVPAAITELQPVALETTLFLAHSGMGGVPVLVRRQLCPP